MMNAYLVSILTWSRPYKTALALLSVNIIFWFLNHQRPICVISLAALCYYLRYLWKHRIRPEVLVDPPDSEDWVTLSSYEFEQQYLSLTKKLWNHWINLRTENHIMWTAVTCTMWIFLAKLGSQLDFITLLFILSNAAFLLVPLLKICPALPELPSDEGVIKEEDLIPEIPKKSKATSKKASPPPRSTPARDLDLAPHPVRVAQPESKSQQQQQTRRMSPTLSTNLTEGMLTRSISAAAATFVTSGLSSSSSVMSASAAVISSLVSQASSQMSGGGTVAEPPTPASALSPRVLSNVLSSSNSGPDSLTPPVMAMPDHEEVADSDPEDEFLFDAKHFDKSSSSSSTSNSFEIINNF